MIESNCLTTLEWCKLHWNNASSNFSSATLIVHLFHICGFLNRWLLSFQRVFKKCHHDYKFRYFHYCFWLLCFNFHTSGYATLHFITVWQIEFSSSFAPTVAFLFPHSVRHQPWLLVHRFIWLVHSQWSKSIEHMLTNRFQSSFCIHFPMLLILCTWPPGAPAEMAGLLRGYVLTKRSEKKTVASSKCIIHFPVQFIGFFHLATVRHSQRDKKH